MFHELFPRTPKSFRPKTLTAEGGQKKRREKRRRRQDIDWKLASVAGQLPPLLSAALGKGSPKWVMLLF